MKRTQFERVVYIGWFGMLAILAALVFCQASSDHVPWSVTSVHAAAELESGMIDPKNGKKIKYWVAPMDPKYIRNEPGKSPMGMDLVPVYEEEGEEKEPSSTIRIDPVTIQNMGVRYGRVESKKLVKSIRTYGNITYDETRVYTVNTKFNGWIEKLYVDFMGDHVTRGQPLFAIYSPELLTAQQEYLMAYQQFRGLPKSASVVARSDALRLLNASRTRLQYWDLTEEQIEDIEKKGTIRKNLTIYSPASGVVTKKNAFEGHYVKAGEHQYEIADLSKVWVDVDIYEYELPWVSKGMPAKMDLPYVPGKKYSGEVLFIYPYLDSNTRTARLRLAFENQDGRLKPGMYANIHLKASLPEATLAIPQEAVIDSGERKIVFVARGKGRFEPRQIEVGMEADDFQYQVLSGVKEGDRIVVSGQFMFDSESRLREAIQKMLAVRQAGAEKSDDDMDMTDLGMSDASDDGGKNSKP